MQTDPTGPKKYCGSIVTAAADFLQVFRLFLHDRDSQSVYLSRSPDSCIISRVRPSQESSQ